MSKLTLGSLFSGSGGFELAALFSGIEPLWASEIAPFPIRVTTKRFPNMKHFGDINKVDGAKAPPVDIITAGFCCQDLSVAGKRAGLKGERSGLFYQIPRIIKEMLTATNNQYPKFAVLENVPGMYSSNNGLDFQEVLNELIKIKNETVSVPLPEKGKWSTSGEIVGDSYSVGWRTLDAQFWGVAQRRRRCYIVVDLTGERAGKILFDESCLSVYPPSSRFPWKTAPRRSETGSGSSVGNVTASQPVVFEPGAASRIGGHVWQDEITGTLRADMGDNRFAVAIQNHPADSRVRIDDSGTIQTLTESMGTGGGNCPLVMNERQYALTVGEDVANTLTGTDFKGTQCVFEPKTLKIRSGCDGGGKGAIIQDNKSSTLSTSNDQTVFVPRVYGICSKASNSMQSDNPHSGIYEAETSRTLDTSVPDPNKNAGGMVIVAVEGNGSRPSHRGDGYGGQVSFTLNSVERHSVCYQDKVGALCASDHKFPQQQQIEEGKAVVERLTVENYQHSSYREIEVGGTLKANGGDYPGGENMVIENRYVVRRLTPTECAMLQGFPPWWCEGLETPDPTEDEIAFWSEVWETERLIKGKSKKPKSRNQIVKWLKSPHSDSAKYMMWGNGVALPCVVYVLSGIACHT